MSKTAMGSSTAVEVFSRDRLHNELIEILGILVAIEDSLIAQGRKDYQEGSMRQKAWDHARKLFVYAKDHG